MKELIKTRLYMTSKDIILRQLTSTSNNIVQKFHEMYKDDLDILTQELATSYNILLQVINGQENSLGDNDFQSANLYWTALNSILAAIDLLQRGYTKEPQMLIRNALETFAVAYDFHENPERYKAFMSNPKKFKSSKSIAEIKKVHTIIGHMYGMLSSQFTHVSGLHILPHKIVDGLYTGGMFDPNDQAIVNLEIASIIQTLDILNSVLELTFLPYIQNPRFWKIIDENSCKYTPNKERTDKILSRIKLSIASLE